MDLGVVPLGMTVAALMAAKSLERTTKESSGSNEEADRAAAEALGEHKDSSPANHTPVKAPAAAAAPAAAPEDAPAAAAVPEDAAAAPGAAREWRQATNEEQEERRARAEEANVAEEAPKPEVSQAVIFKNALKEGFKKGNSLSPALKLAKKDETVLQTSVDGKSLIEWIVYKSISTLESKEFNLSMLGKISSFDYSTLLPKKMRTVKKDKVVMAAKNGGTRRNQSGGTTVSEITELTVLALKAAPGANSVNNAFKTLVTATSSDIKLLKPIFDAFIKFRQNISDAYTIQQIRNAKFMLDGVFDNNGKVNPFFEKAVIAETKNPEFASTGRSKLAEYQNDQALAERIQTLASKYDEAAKKIGSIPDAASPEYASAKREIDAILIDYKTATDKAESAEGGPLAKAAAAAAKAASIEKENSIDEAETRAANIAAVNQEGDKADSAEAVAEAKTEAAAAAAAATAAEEWGRKREQALEILKSPPEIRDATAPFPTSPLRTRKSNFGVKSSLRTRQSNFKGGRHKKLRKSTFRRHRKH